MERLVDMTSGNAFLVLGLCNSATNEQIKRAYRRAISKNHPDRFISMGVTESELRRVTTRTQRIKTAFDCIKRTRGFS